MWALWRNEHTKTITTIKTSDITDSNELHASFAMSTKTKGLVPNERHDIHYYIPALSKGENPLEANVVMIVLRGITCTFKQAQAQDKQTDNKNNKISFHVYPQKVTEHRRNRISDDN